MLCQRNNLIKNAQWSAAIGRLQSTLVLLLAMLFPLCSQAQLSTADIVNGAWCPACIQWKVSGTCFWLTCTPLGCDTDVSVKLSHFIPEAVVTSYSAESPWGIYGAGVNATMSSAENASSAQESGQLRFKNVDIVGSPAIDLFNSIAQNNDLMCATNAQSYFPYFRSILDFVGWHKGIPEMFYPSAYFGKNIDNGDSAYPVTTFDPGYTNWGNLYPRHGFLVQADDYKASAVMAQRAADIVTSASPQPHLYYPMPNQGADCSGKKCWPPGHAELKQANTHLWQRLYPAMADSCSVFGTVDDSEPTAGNQQYAWHLWRPWECCSVEGAIYLGSI